MNTTLNKIKKDNAYFYELDGRFNVTLIDTNYYNDLSKIKINQYHKKFLDNLKILIKNEGISEEYLDYFKELSEYLTYLEENIKIKNAQDYENLNVIIDLRSMFLRRSIEENDLTILANSCNQLRKDISYKDML